MGLGVQVSLGYLKLQPDRLRDATTMKRCEQDLPNLWLILPSNLSLRLPSVLPDHPTDT